MNKYTKRIFDPNKKLLNYEELHIFNKLCFKITNYEILEL
jgi:hypothetical protein